MSSPSWPTPLNRLRHSFSLKLFVLFFSVFVLIALIGGVIYAQTGSALETDTRDTMERTTQLQANGAGEWVDRTRTRTNSLAESPALQSGDDEAITDALGAAESDGGGEVVAALYYDLEGGEVLASSEGGAADAYDDVDLEWVEDAPDETDGAALSRPYQDPVTGQPAVAFASAADGDAAAVLVVDLEARSDQFEQPTASNASFTHVVDSTGTVVFSHHSADIGGQNMGSDEEPGVDSMGVMRGLDGETGYVEMDMMGHDSEMAMGFAPVPGTDWVIMTHEPVDEAYALQGDVTRSVLALLAAALLGLGAVGLVVGRNTTRSVTELAEQASELERGNLDADFETDRVDEIGQLYESFDAMRRSLRDRLEELEATRQRIAEMNDHLESKAEEYSEVMADCADGDLTRRMDSESDSEAMTEIAREFNHMIAELEYTNEQLAAFAADVAASSEEVNASTEEVRSASAQVTESIQEITEGAERQHEYLQETTQEMDSLSTATQQIAATSNQVADLAEQTARAARDGKATAESAIDGMDEIAADSGAAVEEIEALEAEIEQIDELVEFIEELAEQTNMLALNASIEASRTDSSDDGFSVVADEVKELADDTKDATQTIEERIESIKVQTDRSVDTVQQTSDRIAANREDVEQTVDALEEITDYARETNNGVQEISAATQQQAGSTEEVVTMVEEVTTISDEATAETETVAAAGEEQTTSLTEVSRAINDLAQHSTVLSERLDEFETDASVDPDQPFGGIASADDFRTAAPAPTDAGTAAGANDETTNGPDDAAIDGADGTADDATDWPTTSQSVGSTDSASDAPDVPADATQFPDGDATDPVVARATTSDDPLPEDVDANSTDGDES